MRAAGPARGDDPRFDVLLRTMMIGGRHYAGALVVAAVVGACSSSSSGNVPPADASDDGAASNDGGVGTDVSADVPGAPLTTAPLLLTAGVFRSASGGDTVFRFENFVAPPGARCAARSVGACLVVDCRLPSDGGVPQNPRGASAGRVQLVRGTTPFFSAVPGPIGTYAPQTDFSGAVWNPADAMSFAADGADVPAFAQAMTAPARVIVTSPGALDAGAVAIARGSDLVATWQASTGRVAIDLRQSQSNIANTDLRVLCEFAGNAGTGAVPASLTALLDAGVPVSFDVGGITSVDATPGGYHVHVALIDADTFTGTVQ